MIFFTFMSVRQDMQKFTSFYGINFPYVFIFYYIVNLLLLLHLLLHQFLFYHCVIGHLPFSNYDTLWIVYCSKDCKCVIFTALNLTPKYRILKYLSKMNIHIINTHCMPCLPSGFIRIWSALTRKSTALNISTTQPSQKPC